MIEKFKVVQELDLEGIKSRIIDTPDILKYSLDKRIDIAKHIYDYLGYDMTNDILISMLTNPKAKLINAPAGSGKTTFAIGQVAYLKYVGISQKSVYELDGKPMDVGTPNILYLVYNANNVYDIKTRNTDMIVGLRGAFKNKTIDSGIICNTVHSHCYKLLNRIDTTWGDTTKLITSESVKEDIVRSIISIELELLQEELEEGEDVEDKIKIYSKLGNREISAIVSTDLFLRETLRTTDDLDIAPSRTEIPLDTEDIIYILKMMKRKMVERGLVDYTGSVERFLKFEKELPRVRELLDSTYEYIIADEVQDFSPLMFKFLKVLLGDKGDKRLLCIGDEDQSLYQFRGADISSTLDFQKEFEGGEVYNLSINRRCRNNILAAAQTVIEKNTKRMNKDMYSIKEGGEVNIEPYSDRIGQYLKIVRYLKKQDPEYWGKVVIASRDRFPSHFLTDLLEENGISVNILAGHKPRTHYWYRLLYEFFDTFFYNHRIDSVNNLYKYFNSKGSYSWKLYYTHESGGGNRILQIEDLDLSSQIQKLKGESQGQFIKRCNEEKNNLIQVVNIVQSTKLKDLVRNVVKFIESTRYFKSFYHTRTDTDKLYNNYFKERAIKYFEKNLYYGEFLDIERNNEDRTKVEVNAGRAVSLSTFHTLKGLERDEVFIVDLSDDIFPNFKLIDDSDKPEDIKLSEKEAQICTLYVAMTRAKNKLTMYYNEINPSQPIVELLESDFRNRNTLYTKGDTDVTDISNMLLPEKEYSVRNLNAKEKKITDSDYINLDNIVEPTKEELNNSFAFNRNKVIEDISDVKIPTLGDLTAKSYSYSTNKTKELNSKVSEEDDLLLEEDEYSTDTSSVNNTYNSELNNDIIELEDEDDNIIFEEEEEVLTLEDEDELLLEDEDYIESENSLLNNVENSIAINNTIETQQTNKDSITSNNLDREDIESIRKSARESTNSNTEEDLDIDVDSTFLSMILDRI